MAIVAFLKSFIYLAAASLLLPVLVLLALLTIWLVVYSGNFTGLWLERARLRKVKAARLPQLLRLRQAGPYLPNRVNRFLDQLAELEPEWQEAALINLLRDAELQLGKSLDGLKMMIRIGPGLGLIGTLIPMGTGLASLGQGDLSRLSGDLVVAFTTTVVGMGLGLASYFFFTIQRRWLEEDLKNMELAAEVLAGNRTQG